MGIRDKQIEPFLTGDPTGVSAESMEDLSGMITDSET